MKRLDVRAIVPRERHTKVFETFDALAPEGAFELINDHDPPAPLPPVPNHTRWTALVGVPGSGAEGVAREDQQAMTTVFSPAPLDLTSFLETSVERPSRKVLVQQSGLKVMHLTLAPGQALPSHKHPGCYVLLQGLGGVTTVQLEQQETALAPRQLLGFSGETGVSLGNEGNAPSALLITLSKCPERSRGADTAVT